MHGCGDVDFGVIILVLVLIALLIYVISGIKRIPIGAAGVLISLGRRTGNTRAEGFTWIAPGLQRVVSIYLRERQVDIPQANYFTTDRARISFKTTVRVTVADAAALFDQGPGTYAPFTREGFADAAMGSQEGNIALCGLVQNSIRETVQSMTIHDVMFGASMVDSLAQQLRSGIDRSCSRWGLKVVDVWLTDVDAESGDLRNAVQSQVEQDMRGRGELTAHLAQVRKGELFFKVAMETAERISRETGRQVDVSEVQRYLERSYSNEKALEIALTAAGQPGIVAGYYQAAIGVGLPQMAPPLMPGPEPMRMPALPAAVSCPSCGGRLEPDARFCDSCGTSLDGARPSGPAGTPLDGAWTVGREADILVEGDGISRQHCRLEALGGSYTITDLGSSNGTFLNGRQLMPHSPTPVTHADDVTLGKYARYSVSSLVQRIPRR